MLVCLAGVFCNLLLSAGKIAVGVMAGLVSALADGLNNVSDCGSGVVALVSFFIAKKPADKLHPYGHHRAEYVASMIAGFLILCLAAEVLRSSVESVLHGNVQEGSLSVYLVLGISIAVKAGMFVFYKISAKKLGSSVLHAAAADSLCDAFASAAVIAGTLLGAVLPSADGWAGIVVTLFIAWQGIKILADASSVLLGQAPDPSLTDRIKALVLGGEGVIGVHDLQIYSYGKGVSFATIHAEMDASLTMLAAHTVIDGLEARVHEETGVTLTVHLDPVDLDNREESALKIQVCERARFLADGLEVHDFRMIPNTNKVEFDVGVPYDCKLSDEELADGLNMIVTSLGPYEAIIRIERE